jgi:hypothetical protein
LPPNQPRQTTLKHVEKPLLGQCNRLIQGKPGLLVSTNCKLLRKSLAGGYHFKRVAVGAGHERFKDAPNKNEHSHIGDAFGYLMLVAANTGA